MITSESSDTGRVTTVSGLAGARGNEFDVSAGDGTGEVSSVDTTCDGPEPPSVVLGACFSFSRADDPCPDFSDTASSTSVECVGEGPAHGTSLRAIREKREGLGGLFLYTFALVFLAAGGFSTWVDEDGTFSVDEDLLALRREKRRFELVKVFESEPLSLSLSFDSSPWDCDSVVGTGVEVLAIVGSGLGFEGSASGTEVGPCPSSMFVSPGRDTLTAVSSAPDALFSWGEVEEEAIVEESERLG